MKRNRVIGQTGRRSLSTDKLKYKQNKRRTARFQYTKLGRKRWLAWICGPFHSRTYGACGYGSTKERAKAALQFNLANNYRYIGNLMLSDIDDADHIGLSPVELWHRSNNQQREILANIRPGPITASTTGV